MNSSKDGILFPMNLAPTEASLPAPSTSTPPSPWVLTVSQADPGHDCARILRLNDPLLQHGGEMALEVLARSQTVWYGRLVHSAGPTYGNPWVRDSYAWGMVPSMAHPQLVSYSGGELEYWLDRHSLLHGGWNTDPKSGWFDETPIFISAVLAAYRVRGDRRMLARAYPRLLRSWEAVLAMGIRPSEGSQHLLFSHLSAWRFPLTTDWADQVGRRNYSAHLQALWYKATDDLGKIAALVGDGLGARRFRTFAGHIRADIQRLLWCHQSPLIRNAPDLSPMGYFRAWTGGGDYFELDSNMAMVLYGVADAAQAEQIVRSVLGAGDRLLGTEGGPAGAKVVYGDYHSDHYLPNPFFRYYMADDRYHNAFWPSLGGLAALALAKQGKSQAVRRVLRSIAARCTPQEGLFEWYASDGTPGGSRWFQWGARMYLVALYQAYLGLTESTDPEALRVRPLFAGEARFQHLGREIRLRVIGEGTKGVIALDGWPLEGDVIAGDRLQEGSLIEVELRP